MTREGRTVVDKHQEEEPAAAAGLNTGGNQASDDRIAGGWSWIFGHNGTWSSSAVLVVSTSGVIMAG
ncbi:hypothetical protein CH063_11295 [Colletotrichum higginsianum]|uniref:Uncharacterized protein n=1 Tax=Colletotrichum higginsianum (strain IMI 349063) TaxID=759273 RepID=H1VKS4_COLHI|nr:hypothetical protein CH063_11295 [Colletotrichum higginsianum]